MSRMSTDNRSAYEEWRTVGKWALVVLVIITIIGVGGFIWASQTIVHVGL